MAEIDLDLKLDGEESLDEDMREFKNYLLLAITEKALPEVQAAMYRSLVKHVEMDVYAAYEPKEYERRRGGNYALDDFGNPQVFESIGPVGGPIGTGGFELTAGITYDPRGYHSNPAWSTNDDPNEIIGRIENHEPPYKYGRGVPKRQFWQRFVNEMIDGSVIGTTFISAMREAGLDIEMAYDEVEREAKDGDY